MAQRRDRGKVAIASQQRFDLGFVAEHQEADAGVPFPGQFSAAHDDLGGAITSHCIERDNQWRRHDPNGS